MITFYLSTQDDDGSLNRHRITTLLPINGMLWVGTGEGLLTMYTIQDHTHLRQRSQSPLKYGTTCSPRDLRRKARSRVHQEPPKTRESRLEKRLTREQSRSNEMLLNGLVDEEDADWSSDENRLRSKVREKRERAAEIRQARSSRRTRVQELRHEVISSSYPGPETEHSSRTTATQQGTVKVIAAGARSTSTTTQAITTTSTDGHSAVGGGDDRDDIGDGEELGQQEKLIRLQRQRQVSTKTTSSENDNNKPVVQANTSPLNGRSWDEAVGNVDETPEVQCDQAPNDTITGSQAGHSTPAEPEVESIPKELLRSDSLHDEVFQPGSVSQEDSETCSAATTDEVSGRGKTDDSPQDDTVNLQDTVERIDKDFNMNLPPKYLPDILKGTLGKTHAPPQVSTVTAKYSRVLTINVRGPSSASTHSDRDSGEELTRHGLIQEGIFNMEDLNKDQDLRKISAASEKPFVRPKIRNPDYVVKKVKKLKTSTTSTESTSGASTTRSVVSVSSTGSVLGKTPETVPDSVLGKTPVTVPEVEVSPTQESHLARKMSKSMEVLQVTERADTHELLSDSQLQISGAESLLGCSSLSGRSHSPGSTNQRSSRRSDESLALPRTVSSSTLSGGSFSDLTYLIDLAIQTKVKVSDRPVKCLIPIR